LRKLLEEMLPRDQVIERYEVEAVFPAIGHSKVLLNARRIAGRDGEPPLILLALEEEHTH